jgi:hypothetical protein
VLSGELDSITTPAEGDLVTAQFPDAQHITVANSFHVTAVGDTHDCAVRIVRSFVSSPSASIPDRLLRCARRVEPVRAMGRFPALPTYPTSGAVARAAAPGATTVTPGCGSAWTASGWWRGCRCRAPPSGTVTPRP